ncbi:MAG: DUF1963 domain-containing protein [Candidatus Melainabacteria bacterium]|nr:DUF1963 domain-containing protein [Candidatus Melainabacteria bacterium]
MSLPYPRPACLNTLDQLLQKYARPAYQAVLSPAPTDGSTEEFASKFGGAPYFEEGESWPVCTKCGKQETFICQLDLRSCPAVHLPDCFGLLSFFYCFHCFPWDAPQPGWTVRNYRDAQAHRAITLQQAPVKEPGFLKKLFGGHNQMVKCCLVKFELFDCYPQLDELDEIGDDEDKKLLADVELNDTYYERVDELTGKSDNFGTLVGGYSQWIQSFPPDLKCKHCGRWMRQLVQIGSHREADIMFGDAGSIYLSICDEHPQDITMMLQCF